MTKFKTLSIKTNPEGVAWLRLERPHQGNALDAAMAAELVEATAVLEEDPAVGCVVLTGDGPTFCVGGDLRAFSAQGEDLPRYVRRMVADLHTAISRLSRMRAATIAAVVVAGEGEVAAWRS